MKITDKMMHNAHKLTFLVEQYPGHKLADVILLLELPAIEINCAVWLAVQLELVTEPGEKTGIIELISPPEEYDFGDEVADLKDMILYSFQQLAKKETDLEENYLSQWTTGYPSHDVIIAMKLLIDERSLAEYELPDGKEIYKFYTLYENMEQLWGRKQFKKDPIKKKK